VTEEFLPCVLKALMALPSSSRVIANEDATFSVDKPMEAVEVLSQSFGMNVKSTFINVDLPSSLYSKKPNRAAQSH